MQVLNQMVAGDWVGVSSRPSLVITCLQPAHLIWRVQSKNIFKNQTSWRSGGKNCYLVHVVIGHEQVAHFHLYTLS